MANMSYNPTMNTWSQVANQQAYQQMANGSHLMTDEFPVVLDPIYQKLIMEISYTFYRTFRITQKWRNIGRTAPPNQYPGILREILMHKRKGQNYPMDAGVRPSTLNSYEIIDDTIDIRYHTAQFRWMYGWTIFNQELKRYAGREQGDLIAQLSQMKSANMVSARNMFCDNLRKKLLSVLVTQVAAQLTAPVDIMSDDLTEEQAKEWLAWVDNLMFELANGTAKYNKYGEFIEVPRASLQMIIPRWLYYKVMRTAYPLTITNQQYFENCLPSNIILIDTMGFDEVALTGSADPIVPTYNSVGMSLLNWDGKSNDIVNTMPNLQCVIMDRDAIGLEENLTQTLVAPMDIAKLATAVRSHYWTSAYITDMVPSLALLSPASIEG